MSTGTAASAMVYRATINRNKRSLLAYQYVHILDLLYPFFDLVCNG